MSSRIKHLPIWHALLFSTKFPFALIKRPLQMYLYAARFENWLEALRVRAHAFKSQPQDVVTYRLRNGYRLQARHNESIYVGEVLVNEVYAICKMVDNPKVIWDVGGNIGMFAIWAAGYFPTAHYVSFEPVPETFVRMKMNQEANPAIKWECMPYGLSDQDKTVEGFMPADQSVSASEHGTSGKKVSMPLRNINAVWKEKGTPHIDILKIDCEGGEYGIFETVSDELLAQVDLIVMEIHPLEGKDRKNIKKRLESAGFALSWTERGIDCIWAQR